jgi:RsiW-degrading membrane proteinase PrsW (M82 family)
MAFSLPLGVLAMLSLVIGIVFAIFLGTQWHTLSLRMLVGSLIVGAIFLGFGIKLLQALLSRKYDKTTL